MLAGCLTVVGWVGWLVVIGWWMLVGGLSDLLRVIAGWLEFVLFVVIALAGVWLSLSAWFGWSVPVVDWLVDWVAVGWWVVCRWSVVWWVARSVCGCLASWLLGFWGLVDWGSFVGSACGWFWVVVDCVWFFGLLGFVREFRLLVRGLVVEFVGLLFGLFWFFAWFVVVAVPWLCAVGFSVCSFLLGRL